MTNRSDFERRVNHQHIDLVEHVRMMEFGSILFVGCPDEGRAALSKVLRHIANTLTDRKSPWRYVVRQASGGVCAAMVRTDKARPGSALVR